MRKPRNTTPSNARILLQTNKRKTNNSRPKHWRHSTWHSKYKTHTIDTTSMRRLTPPHISHITTYTSPSTLLQIRSRKWPIPFQSSQHASTASKGNILQETLQSHTQTHPGLTKAKRQVQALSPNTPIAPHPQHTPDHANHDMSPPIARHESEPDHHQTRHDTYHHHNGNHLHPPILLMITLQQTSCLKKSSDGAKKTFPTHEKPSARYCSRIYRVPWAMVEHNRLSTN